MRYQNKGMQIFRHKLTCTAKFLENLFEFSSSLRFCELKGNFRVKKSFLCKFYGLYLGELVCKYALRCV